MYYLRKILTLAVGLLCSTECIVLIVPQLLVICELLVPQLLVLCELLVPQFTPTHP